jgi:tetratricopeptide (TPR) repeat protein
MENKTPSKQRWLDGELLWVIAFFGLIWLGIGGAVFYYSSAIACMNFKLADPATTCGKALSLSLVPAEIKSQLRLKLIERHIELSENDKALAVIASEEEASGQTISLLEKKSELLKNEGRSEEAATAFRDILKLDAKHEDAASSLTRIEVDANNFDAARKTAATFVETTPDSALMISWQGWIEHRAGDQKLALAFFDRAISLEPETAYLHRDVADIKLAANDYAGAIAAMTLAIKFAPEDTAYLEKRADIYDMIGELKLSQADYEKVLSISRNASTLISLGRSYTDSEDFEKARVVLDEAIAQDYEITWAYDSKIRMYVRQGNLAEARTTIDQLLKIDPENVDAKYWKATISYEEGRYDIALQEYEKILKDAPNYTEAMIDAGHSLIELKRAKESLPYFTNAIANRPNSDYAYASRARAHFHMENWWATVSDANQAIKLRPGEGVAYARRGLAWAKLGKIQEAKTSLEAAAKYAPKVEWVQRYNLEFLIEHNFLAEAQTALSNLKTVSPDSKLVPEFETILRTRGVKIP